MLVVTYSRKWHLGAENTEKAAPIVDLGAHTPLGLKTFLFRDCHGT